MTVTETCGGIRYNRATGRFVETVTLTNNGTAVTGPISLALDKLSTKRVTLFNQTGTYQRNGSGRQPLHRDCAGDMPVGASVS